MRIRKQYQVIPTNAKLENGDSTSATNGYTAEYINNHSVVVSAEEPSGSARKKVWKQHSKNLFNKNNANILNAYLNNLQKIQNSDDERTIYIQCKPNTTYTISKAIATPADRNRFRVGTTATTPSNAVSLLNYVYYNVGNDKTSITITTPATANYLCVYCWATDNTSTLQQMLDSIQIEQGSTATTYEPYVYDKEHILNDNDEYEEFNENVYSINEIKIGTWIDGKPIYRKVVDFGVLPNAGSKNVAHNISNIDIITNIKGTSHTNNGTTFNLPHISKNDIGSNVAILCDKTNITIETGTDRSIFIKTYVTLEYTKTTD